ncbi:MAG: polyribonucleotide nucleotidyltransferase, partial [Bdellovibrionales bacterium]|nr:polyribonucleotide nucleotidyltransferase [Bdellovibrionales bacterium]
MKQTVTMTIGSQTIEIETGRMAKQADGSVVVTAGNNTVLVTVVSSKRESDMDFFPLTVEYAEKFYASGKIPGGFFKREGRPTAEATLNARLIDRPLRPTFPEGYNKDTQVVATILSYDGTYPVEILASIGASCATHISDIPFNGPTAAIMVGKVDGQFVANPSPEQLEKSEVDLIVAGTRNGILMVEGEATLVDEATILEALKFAHKEMGAIFDAQDQLRELTGNTPKREFIPYSVDADFKTKVAEFAEPKIAAALSTVDKGERYQMYDDTKKEAEKMFLETIADKDEREARKKDLGIVIGDLKYDIARSNILKKGQRIDGRELTTVRNVTCEVGFLPRVHGSGLFTRGETQVLGCVTLGTGDDEQSIDSLAGMYKKKFILHYNFPTYCVGETGSMGGQSRREIGHGNLAERAHKA